MVKNVEASTESSARTGTILGKSMAGDFILTLEPHGLQLTVRPYTTVLKALQKLQIILRNDCGGIGVCGKCRIISLEEQGLSAPTATEKELLESSRLPSGSRMACQAEIIGNAKISLAAPTDDRCDPAAKNLSGTRCSVAPAVRRIFLPGEETPGCSSAIAGLQTRFKRHLPHEPVPDTLSFDVTALQQMSRIAENKDLTLVAHEVRGITAVVEGKRTSSLGLAIDLGTTTIAVYLCDLVSGRHLTSAAAFNPQRSHGDDVISRIGAATCTEGVLSQLQKSAVSAINQLIENCLKNGSAEVDEIDEVVVVGNTTMQTIFSGIFPESLGKSPYLPLTSEALNLRAADVGLNLNPGTNIYIFPVIAAFLGGDAVGAALGDTLSLSDEVRLIIDIGTNGEIVLGNRKKILATSCATGPALEGANISCGMRATNGAVDRIVVDANTGKLLYRTIGREKGFLPAGICGSGLIDAMAALRQVGILQESGRLQEGCEGVICDESGIGQAYILVPAEESATGQPIAITLKDVRAFQLAKSALATGIEKLLDRFEVDEVRKTVITGAFGVSFHWQSGVAVGMIPERIARGEVISVKNLAGVGAMLALLDGAKRKQAEELARRCQCVDLAMDPDFNEHFVSGTRFPACKN